MAITFYPAKIPHGLLQANTVLPSQYLRARHGHAPEKRLMIAVLQDAINCIEKYRFATDRRGRQHLDEVTEWLLADETRWPFSFRGICDVLGLDAPVVRHHLGVTPARAPLRDITPDTHRQQ